MSLIIDLTAEFKRARASSHTDRLGSMEDDHIFMEPAEPSWMKAANKLRADIVTLQQTLGRIEEKERQRQKSMFNEILATEIRSLSESATKQIEVLRAEITSLSTQALDNANDDALKQNVIGSLFAGLRKEIQNLQNIQQRYVVFLGTAENNTNGSTHNPPKVVSNALSPRSGLTAEEMQIRQQEIEHITSGISEISQIIAQMAEFVYEQGTILDRIDANIYEAAAYAEEGKDILKNVKKTQKKMRWCKRLIYIIIGIDYALLLTYIFLKVI